MAADYSHPDLRRNICLDHLVHILAMIILELEDDEAISLLVAGRAMALAYETNHQIEEEAYLRLRVACEKLDLLLWGIDDRQRTSP